MKAWLEHHPPVRVEMLGRIRDCRGREELIRCRTASKGIPGYPQGEVFEWWPSSLWVKYRPVGEYGLRILWENHPDFDALPDLGSFSYAWNKYLGHFERVEYPPEETNGH